MLVSLIVLVFLFIANNSTALKISEYNVSFYIQPNMDVEEKISIKLENSFSSTSVTYATLGDISNIKIYLDGKEVNYNLTKSGSDTIIIFVIEEGVKNVEINFVTKDIVFIRDNLYMFSTELKPSQAEVYNIYVYLPKGYSLYREVIYPENYQILTDGEKIFIKWVLQNKNPIFLSFKFYRSIEDYSLITGLFLTCGFLIAIAYLVGYYKKKVKEEFQRGFTEDERKVLFILSRDKIVMQKKIEKELGFSRAKMTRIVKKLEAKGLIEKERVGRTNRIFYKRRL
ncbi:MAG: MarR family transcriptional regulator [Candidatus Aenigmatarchaeota archaeon]